MAAKARPGLTQIDGDHIGQATAVALTAAGTEDEIAVWKNNTGQKVRITEAGYLPDEVPTGADTNSVSLQFKSRTSAGAAKANITAIKNYTAGVNIVKLVQDSLVLATTLTDRDVDDDELVTLDITKPGTGLALPAGIAVITYQFI